MPKKVWCLYRVSTKSQVNTDEDIPIQKQACENFVKMKNDWEITNELYERGVSGWKKKADERDALNTIREAAVNGEFDVLLVYMFDRLGRRDDETPFVINFLHQQNVEVWSVQEGHRKLDSHVDKLINYISSWQASGESIKISMRAREAKKQLSEQGFFQGGSAPFGYKIVDTDVKHWKDQERYLKELIPDEYESNVVKIIYDLYVTKHYGYRKIVDYLNENGFKNRKDKLFRVNLIKRILDNPIFIGRKRYESFDGKEGDTQPYNEKLRIISDEIFFKAQEIKEKRNQSLKKQDKSGIPMSGRLMFSGLAYCGYCGSKLSGNYLYRKNKKPHNPNEYYTNTIYRYRCPLNEGKSGHKHEKNIWGAKKFDEQIIQNIKGIMNSIDIEHFIDTSVSKKKFKMEEKELRLDGLEKEKNQLQKQITKLNGEIANALIGESVFTPDQLSKAINASEQKLEGIEDKIQTLSHEVAKEKGNFSEIMSVAEELNNWEEKFDNADDDLRKAMLTRIVNKVILGKDKGRIKFRVEIEDIVQQSLLNK